MMTSTRLPAEGSTVSTSQPVSWCQAHWATPKEDKKTGILGQRNAPSAWVFELVCCQRLGTPSSKSSQIIVTLGVVANECRSLEPHQTPRLLGRGLGPTDGMSSLVLLKHHAQSSSTSTLLRDWRPTTDIGLISSFRFFFFS